MTDYTRDQLMQGLRAAHDAGDEAAATAIAGRIQSLGTAPAAAPATSTSSTSAAAPSSDIAQPDTLPALNPLTASTGDYLAKLHQAVSGLGQIGGFAENYGRVAANTYGLGDRTLSAVTGTPLAEERARTATAQQAIGPAGTFAANMTGAGPLGQAGKAVGEAVLPVIKSKWLSGVLGAGSVGVGSTEAGSYGRTGESASPLALGLSAASGVPGGVVGRGGKLVGPTEDALRQQATTAYEPLSANFLHGAQDVHPPLAQVEASFTPGEITSAPSAMGVITRLRKNPWPTGKDIQMAQQKLRDIANNPKSTGNEEIVAKQFSSALDDVLNTAAPHGYWGPSQGAARTMVINPPGAGVPGILGKAKAAGNIPFGRAEDVARISGWEQNAARAGGPDVGTQAKNWLGQEGPYGGKTIAPPGSPLYDATDALAAKAGPISAKMMPGSLELRHALGPILGGMALGGVGGVATGQSWDKILAEAGAGGLAGYISHVALPSGQARNRGIAQRGLTDAAKATAATGTLQNPIIPPAEIRDLLRQLYLPQVAAGSFSGGPSAQPAQTR